MEKNLLLKFKRIFSSLPLSEKKLPIVKINNRFYTWEEIYKEIKKKSVLSEKMLEQLKKMGLV
jgi:hypothetical protein